MPHGLNYGKRSHHHVTAPPQRMVRELLATKKPKSFEDAERAGDHDRHYNSDEERKRRERARITLPTVKGYWP